MPSTSLHYRAYGLSIESDLELPGLAAHAAGPSDVRIEVAPVECGSVPGPGDWSHLGSQRSVLVKQGVGVMEVRDGNRIVTQPSAGAERQLAHFVLGPAMALLLQQRGLYCLHASGVTVEGRTALFAGDSGAGKSTLAQAMVAAGHPLLTDDIAAVAHDAEPPTVAPGHAALRMWPADIDRIDADPALFDLVHGETEKRIVPLGEGDRVADAAPLAGVFVLAQGEHEAIDRIEGLDAAVALLRYCFYARLLSGVQGANELMRQCTRIARHVPVYRLTRRDDPTRLAMLAERLATTLTNDR